MIFNIINIIILIWMAYSAIRIWYMYKHARDILKNANSKLKEANRILQQAIDLRQSASSEYENAIGCLQLIEKKVLLPKK